jgi:hypothetical protein
LLIAAPSLAGHLTPVAQVRGASPGQLITSFEMTALHSIGIGLILVLSPGVILLGLVLWYTAEGSKD